MRKIIIGLGSCLCLLIGPTGNASEKSDFESILEEHWTRAQQEQIFFRTDPDGYRPNGKLAEVNDAARARRESYNNDILRRLEAIDPEKLEGQSRISFKLFRYEREIERQSYQFFDHLFPITSLFGYHSYFANAPQNMSFSTPADYERYLISLADFPRYNREHIKLLEAAIEKGYTQYCESMDDYDLTISQLIFENPRDSSLYTPFKSLPSTFAEEVQSDLKVRGAAMVRDAVVPAYRELYAFFTESYMPNCRGEVGISQLKGGEDYYAYLIRYFTTTDMSAKEIHDLGLSETARIRTEMDAIIDGTGFEGSFEEFLDYLRSEPKFYASDSRDLLEKTAFIAKKMDGLMPRYFGLLARNTYEIRGTQGRGAYYVSGDPTSGTPGIYHINVSDLASQPLYNLESLTLHEAVPGHHHQTALALELDLPEFRKTVYHSAFGEGWALYSESLGKEAGFYADPYSDFGRLTYEMWRANRLVVDTGLHAFGWSRQKAIDYMLANSALTRTEVTNEVDRYITWPAQATSYKIGELRIRALRDRAEDALGADFDIRSFHDVVVGNGSIAIAILEEIVEEWIAGQRE